MLRKYIILCLLAAPLSMRAQTDISWEVAAQTTNSSGDHTPLWLNANKRTEQLGQEQWLPHGWCGETNDR